jgi:hypothetical protein
VVRTESLRTNRHDTGSTTARSVDELALIRDIIRHYAPVLIAPLSIQIRHAGVQKKFVGPSNAGIVTQGLAKMVTEDLIPCANPKPGMNLRKNPVGKSRRRTGRSSPSRSPTISRLAGEIDWDFLASSSVCRGGTGAAADAAGGRRISRRAAMISRRPSMPSV